MKGGGGLEFPSDETLSRVRSQLSANPAVSLVSPWSYQPPPNLVSARVVLQLWYFRFARLERKVSHF